MDDGSVFLIVLDMSAWQKPDHVIAELTKRCVTVIGEIDRIGMPFYGMDRKMQFFQNAAPVINQRMEINLGGQLLPGHMQNIPMVKNLFGFLQTDSFIKKASAHRKRMRLNASDCFHGTIVTDTGPFGGQWFHPAIFFCAKMHSHKNDKEVTLFGCNQKTVRKHTGV